MKKLKKNLKCWKLFEKIEKKIVEKMLKNVENHLKYFIENVLLKTFKIIWDISSMFCCSLKKV